MQYVQCLHSTVPDKTPRNWGWTPAGILESHNTPTNWGLSKPCQYPVGKTPRNWGSRGQNGSGEKRGIAWGTGKIRGFFVPKIIFFWGSNFRGFFVTALIKFGLKIKNLWGSRVQALSPTESPRSSHVLFNCWVGCRSHDSYPCLREIFEGFSLINTVQHCGLVVGA